MPRPVHWQAPRSIELPISIPLLSEFAQDFSLLVENHYTVITSVWHYKLAVVLNTVIRTDQRIIGADCPQALTIVGKDLDWFVVSISDDDVAFSVNWQTVRVLELMNEASFSPELTKIFALIADHLNAVVATVSHYNFIAMKCYPSRAVKLSSLVAFAAERS